MKLYDGGRAPNPRRIRMFLAEKGIEVPLVPVDMSGMQHRSPEIGALNPFQRLPILELDDGTIITETVAISRYFEELHPEPPMFGVDALDRALVEMWQRRVELHVFVPISSAFRHTHPAMVEWEVPQIPAWGEANREKAKDALRVMNDQLATHEFIAGDRYTIADITLLASVDFMKPAKIAMPDDLANLRRWYEMASNRPSAKA
jgi:glutathione S-transferase